jgi:predicted Zn-ribbon and HTH transcriptional regulator
MKHDPPARGESIRRALLAELERGPASAHELSGAVGIPERDVAQHLQHLARTAKARGETLLVEPARCEGCGFKFEKRERFTKPGRCPACRGSHLVAPRFALGRR